MSHTWMDAVSFAAREVYGLPEAWEGSIFTKVGPPKGPSFGLMVRGAVSPPYVRGSRKGEPNWPKRDRATECEVYVSHDQVSAAQARLFDMEQRSAAA